MNVFDLLPSKRRASLTAYINDVLAKAEQSDPGAEHCIVADMASYTNEDIVRVTSAMKPDYHIHLVRIAVPFRAVEIYIKSK